MVVTSIKDAKLLHSKSINKFSCIRKPTPVLYSMPSLIKSLPDGSKTHLEFTHNSAFHPVIRGKQHRHTSSLAGQMSFHDSDTTTTTTTHVFWDNRVSNTYSENSATERPKNDFGHNENLTHKIGIACESNQVRCLKVTDPEACRTPKESVTMTFSQNDSSRKIEEKLLKRKCDAQIEKLENKILKTCAHENIPSENNSPKNHNMTCSNFLENCSSNRKHWPTQYRNSFEWKEAFCSESSPEFTDRHFVSPVTDGKNDEYNPNYKQSSSSPEFLNTTDSSSMSSISSLSTLSPPAPSPLICEPLEENKLLQSEFVNQMPNSKIKPTLHFESNILIKSNNDKVDSKYGQDEDLCVSMNETSEISTEKCGKNIKTIENHNHELNSTPDQQANHGVLKQHEENTSTNNHNAFKSQNVPENFNHERSSAKGHDVSQNENKILQAIPNINKHNKDEHFMSQHFEKANECEQNNFIERFGKDLDDLQIKHKDVSKLNLANQKTLEKVSNTVFQVCRPSVIEYSRDSHTFAQTETINKPFISVPSDIQNCEKCYSAENLDTDARETHSIVPNYIDNHIRPKFVANHSSAFTNDDTSHQNSTGVIVSTSPVLKEARHDVIVNKAHNTFVPRATIFSPEDIALRHRVLVLLWVLLGERRLREAGYPEEPVHRVLWRAVDICCSVAGVKSAAAVPLLPDHDCDADMVCFRDHAHRFLEVCAPTREHWKQFGWASLTVDAVVRKIYEEELVNMLQVQMLPPEIRRSVAYLSDLDRSPPDGSKVPTPSQPINGPPTGKLEPTSVILPTKKKRGRPAKIIQKVDEGGRVERVMLWRFLLNLLEDQRNSPCIHWVQREEGIFRIFNTDWLARLWGRRHGNPKMTYEKMARAMRTYYRSKVLQPVPRLRNLPRKLVYKFNPAVIHKVAAMKQSCSNFSGRGLNYNTQK